MYSFFSQALSLPHARMLDVEVLPFGRTRPGLLWCRPVPSQVLGIWRCPMLGTYCTYVILVIEKGVLENIAVRYALSSHSPAKTPPLDVTIFSELQNALGTAGRRYEGKLFPLRKNGTAKGQERWNRGAGWLERSAFGWSVHMWPGKSYSNFTTNEISNGL